MRERIANHIALNGPMPFDLYMEWCLYDPDDGFFSAGPVRSGKHGDFVTSPEISWVFGSCVGEWARKNTPSSNASLVEIGAGSGALLREITKTWTTGPICAVELSAEAQRGLSLQFQEAEVVGSIDEIPRGGGAVVIANEVLDNMPAALARRIDNRWVEIAVGINGGALVLVDVSAREEVRTWCDEAFSDVRAGTVVSAQLAVADWIEDVFEHFGGVSMCLIDYGGTSDELASRHPSEVVRTYRQHQTGVDWLQSPGESDVTVDVNIDGVVAAVGRAGRGARVLTQRDFCLEHGLDELITKASELEQVAARAGDVMAQLENRSERLDFEALVSPTGLGDFRVVLIEREPRSSLDAS